MSTNKNKRSREKGFILIVAITILMGILAVVTTLVRLSKDSTDHQRNFLKTNQALNAVLDTGLGWVEYLFRNRSGDQATTAHQPYSRLQQNWWGYGMQGLPFTLKLAEDVSDGEVLIDVETLRPLFLALAVNQATGITIDQTAMYTIENEELMIGSDKVGGGMAFSTLGFTGNDEVFGVSTAMQTGYINIGERWLKVNQWEVSTTVDRIRVVDLNVRDDNSSMEAYEGESITYYPFDPALDIGENRGGLVITFDDEAGKFNINSLTKSALNTMGYSATSQGNYLQGMMFNFRNDNTDESYLPHRSHHEIANRSGSTIFSNFLTTQKFTPYSKALIARDREATSMRGHSSFNEVLSIDTSDINEPLAWSGSGSRTQHYVTRPPVNINTANFNTLKLLFETIIGDSATDSEKPETLANSVVQYRYNDFAVGRVIPNPFDGMDNTDETNPMTYPSPEEEFRAFLLNPNSNNYDHDFSGDSAKLNNLMAHVYYEAYDLEHRLELIGGSNYLSAPIGFEWDDTWTINITSTSGYDDRPSSTRSHNIVAVPTNRSSDGEIHINSSTGWNRAYSTFHGVTRKQPIVNYDRVNSPDEIEIDEGAIRHNLYGNFHVAGGMHGRFDTDAGINIRSFLRYSESNSTQAGNMIYSIDLNGNSSAAFDNAILETPALDLGLRVITEDGADLDADGLYGANITIAGNHGIGSTTIYADSPIIPNTAALWTNRWLVYSDNIGTGPEYLEVATISGCALTVTATTFALDGGEQLFLIPEYHPDYIEATDTDSDHPYYETIVHVPGAHQFTVDWYDSNDAGGARVVNAYYYNIVSDNWIPIAGSINSENYVRLRFSFNVPPGSSSRPDLAAPAQLFGIKINYSIRNDAPPMYILNRN